jgi:hypothetical protein
MRFYVCDNHVRHIRRNDVKFLKVPGRVEVQVPCTTEFIPDWALHQIRHQVPGFGASGWLTMVGLDVLKPGLIRVQGAWLMEGNGVIITEDRLSFLSPGLREPVSYMGPIELALFGFK